jgi:hypothetical protein
MVRETVAPGVIDRIIALDGHWERSAVENMLRVFYQQNHGRYALFRLTVAPTAQAAYRALSHGNDRATYNLTVAELKRLGLPLAPVGQLLGIGQSAVMLFRDGDLYSRQILGGGPDPTMLSVRGGKRFQLLHFHITESKQADPKIYSLRIFLKCDRPVSIAACISATKLLAQRFAVRPLLIEIRPDEWFVESPEFPALYPFTRDLRIPTEGEFRLAPSVSCGQGDDRDLTCSGTTFRP